MNVKHQALFEPTGREETRMVLKMSSMNALVAQRLRIRHCPFCSSGSIPGQGTSACHRCSQKKRAAIFFFGRGGSLRLMEFPGQGSDPSHRGNISHSCGNARSLTQCAGPGTKPATQRSQDAAHPIVPQGSSKSCNPYLLSKSIAPSGASQNPVSCLHLLPSKHCLSLVFLNCYYLYYLAVCYMDPLSSQSSQYILSAPSPPDSRSDAHTGEGLGTSHSSLCPTCSSNSRPFGPRMPCPGITGRTAAPSRGLSWAWKGHSLSSSHATAS